MSEQGEARDYAATRVHHERPFLYSWNRRLRHLHGISLRNLHLASPSPRPRGKTIADDEAPYNFSSPAKRTLQSQSDIKTLSQSRSFSNLTSSANNSSSAPRQPGISTSPQKDGETRPGPGRLRRRSTLHWGSSNPRARQSKMEDMIVNHLVDCFVSVHCPGIEDPVYITEVIERSMNPSFAFFDLDGSGPQVSRSDECTLRVWTKPSKSDDYCLLIELDANLRSLHFIGRSLENFHHPLPQNCILFHLTDGIYTSFTDLPAETQALLPLQDDPKEVPSKTASSFDALMQLANLDECIQDAVNVRSKLEEDINKIVADNKASGDDESKPPGFDENSPQVWAALAIQQKRLRQKQKQLEEKKASIARRRKVLEMGRQTDVKIRALIEERTQECRRLDVEIEKIKKLKDGQVRRICEDLLTIFPIEPVKNRTLQFTIAGIHLPNSVYDDTNRDDIAAALGFTAQLLYQLSLYLSIYLPYPIEPYGSESFINDPISAGLTQRRYPLHPTNIPYKFEYGVFLLNKDIEHLMNRSGLRALDIRHTLPNLKYLLYVLTAGVGELPARKAGGVRGLAGGSMTSDLSRKPSEDSMDSQAGFRKHVPQKDTLQVNGSVQAKEKGHGTGDDSLVTTLPVRGLADSERLSSKQDK